MGRALVPEEAEVRLPDPPPRPTWPEGRLLLKMGTSLGGGVGSEEEKEEADAGRNPQSSTRSLWVLSC